MDESSRQLLLLILVACAVMSFAVYTCTKACGCIIKCRDKRLGSNVRFGYGRYVPAGQQSPYTDSVTSSDPPTPPQQDIV
jgi:hypothetical protein